jgi:uncharacterized membrane protein (UPF0127 family)
MIARRTLLGSTAALLAPTAARAQEQEEPMGPQPELPKEKLVIVTKDGTRHDFQVEVARTLEQQRVGEMFRTQIPADQGMLFDWGVVRESDMWMRNTLVPLDMLFIGPHGTIRHIAEDTVPHSEAIIPSGGPVRATLEVAGGTAKRLGIVVGDKVLNPVFGT